MKIAVLTLCLLGTLILAPRAALADASCAAERGDSDLDVLLSNENPFPAGGGGEAAGRTRSIWRWCSTDPDRPGSTVSSSTAPRTRSS